MSIRRRLPRPRVSPIASSDAVFRDGPVMAQRPTLPICRRRSAKSRPKVWEASRPPPAIGHEVLLAADCLRLPDVEVWILDGIVAGLGDRALLGTLEPAIVPGLAVAVIADIDAAVTALRHLQLDGVPPDSLGVHFSLDDAAARDAVPCQRRVRDKERSGNDREGDSARAKAP